MTTEEQGIGTKPKRTRTKRGQAKAGDADQGLNRKPARTMHWKVFLDEGSGPREKLSAAENARRPWRFAVSRWGDGIVDRVMFTIPDDCELWEDAILVDAKQALVLAGRPFPDRIVASRYVRELFGRPRYVPETKTEEEAA